MWISCYNGKFALKHRLHLRKTATVFDRILFPEVNFKILNLLQGLQNLLSHQNHMANLSSAVLNVDPTLFTADSTTTIKYARQMVKFVHCVIRKGTSEKCAENKTKMLPENL